MINAMAANKAQVRCGYRAPVVVRDEPWQTTRPVFLTGRVPEDEFADAEDRGGGAACRAGHVDAGDGVHPVVRVAVTARENHPQAAGHSQPGRRDLHKTRLNAFPHWRVRRSCLPAGQKLWRFAGIGRSQGSIISGRHHRADQVQQMRNTYENCRCRIGLCRPFKRCSAFAQIHSGRNRYFRRACRHDQCAQKPGRRP